MTSANNNFNDFLKLKESLKGLKYKGYNLSSASSSGLIDIMYNENRKLAAIKKIISNLFFKNIAHKKFSNGLRTNNKRNIFTYATSRDTHHELICSYIDSFGVKGNSEIFNILSKRKLCLNIITSIHCMRLCFFNNLKIKLSDMLLVFSAIFEAVCEISEIEKEFSEARLPHAYLPFNSAWGSENLYTQFFKKNGCLTLSLQHAMYYEFTNDIPLDAINYTNVESDYLLSWGSYSKEQIKKYIPNNVNILKVGNPLFCKNLLAKNLLQTEPGLDLIFIPIPRKIYIKEVESLFYVLSTNKKLASSKLYVRLHPSWDIEQFLKLIPIAIKDNIFLDKERNIYSAINQNKFSLIISFNTTAVFEVIQYSDRLLIFNSGSNEFSIPELNTFSNVDELNEKLNLLPFNVVNENYFFTKTDRDLVTSLLNN